MRALLAVLALLAASPAGASTEFTDDQPHTSPTIGARAIFYRPRDADHGVWGPGVQMRMHGDERYAVEVSIDKTQHTSAGANIRTIPVQLSLIGFFTPESKISPYFMIGYGWYLRKLDNHSDRLQHPHAGLGVHWLALESLSLDAGYRLLWSAAWRSTDYLRPFGRNYRDRGSMFVASANYRF